MWNHAGGAFGDAAVHSVPPMPASAPAPSGFGDKGHGIAHLAAVYWRLRLRQRHIGWGSLSSFGLALEEGLCGFELARQLHKPGEVR